MISVPYLLMAFFVGIGAGLLYFAASTSHIRQLLSTHRPQPRRLLLCFRGAVAKDSGKSFGFHYRAGLSGAPDSFLSSKGTH